DGRNRLDAMELAGVDFELAYLPASRGMVVAGPRWWIAFACHEASADHPLFIARGDPYELVLSLNVHRRHLTWCCAAGRSTVLACRSSLPPAYPARMKSRKCLCYRDILHGLTCYQSNSLARLAGNGGA